MGRRRHLLRPEPDRPPGRRLRGDARQAEDLRARHVPLPERRRAARRAPAGLHRHRRVRPLLAHDRSQRAAHHGVRCVRPPCRAVRGADRPAPAHHHRGERRELPASAPPPGPGPRPPPLHLDDRRHLLPLDAVDLPEDLQQLVRRRGEEGAPDRRARGELRVRRARRSRWTRLGEARLRAATRGRRLLPSCVPRRSAGELVPRIGHSAGQRRGDVRRTQRSRQLPCLQAPAEAVEDADHRVRRPFDRRPRRLGLARADQADTAQLDRSQRRRADPLPRAVHRRADHRVHHAPRHHVRRDLHGPCSRASARRRARAVDMARGHAPEVDRRRRRHAVRRSRGLPPHRGVADGRRASGRVAPEDRRLHRRVRDESCDWRVDPGVRRRLRADGLRHRGDHGGARSGRARLGVRRGVRPADRAHRAAPRRLGGRSLRGRGPRDQQWLPRRARRRGREAQDHRVARAERLRRGHGHVPAPRLAVQPAALLGRAVPDHLRRHRSADRRPRVDAARAAP